MKKDVNRISKAIIFTILGIALFPLLIMAFVFYVVYFFR